MRKLTYEEEGNLIELVGAFAEDHAQFIQKFASDPKSVNLMHELLTAEKLGKAIATYVESLL